MEQEGSGNVTAGASTSADAGESGAASEGEKGDANDYSRFDDLEDSDEDEVVEDKDSLTVAERSVARGAIPHDPTFAISLGRAARSVLTGRGGSEAEAFHAPHPGRLTDSVVSWKPVPGLIQTFFTQFFTCTQRLTHVRNAQCAGEWTRGRPPRHLTQMPARPQSLTSTQDPKSRDE